MVTSPTSWMEGMHRRTSPSALMKSERLLVCKHCTDQIGRGASHDARLRQLGVLLFYTGTVMHMTLGVVSSVVEMVTDTALLSLRLDACSESAVMRLLSVSREHNM